MAHIPHWFWLVFLAALGACIGSFLNVVVWRMPRGLSIVLPASACPGCGHGLAANDNLPVIGWILLRGRCRYCNMAISPEYPAVEAYTGLLFAGLYALCYMTPLRPAFAQAGFGATWPVFALHLALASALVAVTLVDTAFAIIPLGIPNFVAGAALFILPLAAATGYAAPGGAAPLAAEPWVFAVFSRAGLLAVGGAVLMLGVANLLLWLRILPHSFDGEFTEQAEENLETEAAKPWALKSVLQAAAAAWLLAFGLALAVGLATGRAASGVAAGVVAALPLGLVALAVQKAQAIPDLPTNAEAMPPLRSPAKVVLREALFMAFPLVGAVLGVGLAGRWQFDAAALPLWFKVAAGVAAGYLVGSGLTWAVRIGGTLAFRKEAMGLGDVHLMGAIGAVLGPVAVVAVFFMLAPFMGLLGALGLFMLGKLKNAPRAAAGADRPSSGLAFPYGPYLALAALLVMGVGLALPDQAVSGLLARFLTICGLDPNNTPGILSTLHTAALQLAK